jgi:hypothetical protein
MQTGWNGPFSIENALEKTRLHCELMHVKTTLREVAHLRFRAESANPVMSVRHGAANYCPWIAKFIGHRNGFQNTSSCSSRTVVVRQFPILDREFCGIESRESRRSACVSGCVEKPVNLAVGPSVQRANSGSVVFSRPTGPVSRESA